MSQDLERQAFEEIDGYVGRKTVYSPHKQGKAGVRKLPVGAKRQPDRLTALAAGTFEPDNHIDRYVHRLSLLT